MISCDAKFFYICKFDVMAMWNEMVFCDEVVSAAYIILYMVIIIRNSICKNICIHTYNIQQGRALQNTIMKFFCRRNAVSNRN